MVHDSAQPNDDEWLPTRVYLIDNWRQLVDAWTKAFAVFPELEPIGGDYFRQSADAMVHHIANAHQSEYGYDQEETISIIRRSFEAEMDNPTSKRLGKFVKEKRDEAEPSGTPERAAGPDSNEEPSPPTR